MPYLVTGSLGNVGGRFMLNLKLLQVEDARVAERVTQIYKDEGALVDGLSGAIASLIGGVALAREVSAPKAPVAAPPKVATASSASPRPYALSGSLLAVGVGAVTASYAVVRSAQSDHNDARSIESAEALEAAVSVGNGLLVAGLGSVAAGVVTWIW